jgi:hypothetical protein
MMDELLIRKNKFSLGNVFFLLTLYLPAPPSCGMINLVWSSLIFLTGQKLFCTVYYHTAE